MKILHVVDVKNPSGNGVAVAVREYAEHESKFCQVGVLNLGTRFSFDDNVDVFCDWTKKNILDYYRPDIVIFNEVYKKEYLKIYIECIRKEIPYIIIPHGCLTYYSQRIKFFKKSLANLFFFNRFINRASAIQFLNSNEKDNTHITKTRSIICGNGTDEKGFFSDKPKSKNIVYIGRYDSYIKGLDVIFEMCKNHSQWFRDNDVTVELYGRNSRNTIKELVLLSHDYHIDDFLYINDALYGEKKEQKLLNCYAFIQASRMEAQPLGIIEALSYGVPCIVTEGTSFAKCVERYNCGFGSECNSNKLFKNVKTICESPTIRKRLSYNARNYIKNNLLWDDVIISTINKYDKIVDEYKGIDGKM